MKRHLAGLICFILVAVFNTPHGRACTTFQLNHEGQVFVGKNYDWMVEDGLIIVNKRGVTKTAMKSTVDNTGLGTPATWTAKYGSITFAQYGRELGPGGMNEAGLVVESMGLFRNTPNRKYPEMDKLLVAQRMETDPKRRNEILCQIARLINDEVPILYRGGMRSHVITIKEVEGLSSMKDGIVRLESVWLNN